MVGRELRNPSLPFRQMAARGGLELSDNRSAQSREGLPPESGKDTDVCRWRSTRADPLLSRSPYWWRRPRQTHLLPIGIATASPSRRFRYERNRRPRPLVPRVPCGWKNKVSKRHRLTQPLLMGDVSVLIF